MHMMCPDLIGRLRGLGRSQTNVVPNPYPLEGAPPDHPRAHLLVHHPAAKFRGLAGLPESSLARSVGSMLTSPASLRPVHVGPRCGLDADQRPRSDQPAHTTHARPRWLIAPPQPSASHRLLGQPPPSSGVAAPSSAASLWPARPNTHEPLWPARTAASARGLSLACDATTAPAPSLRTLRN